MDTLESKTKIEERICNNATLNNIPISGAIELLPLCNMNCNMCYISMSKSEMNSKGHIRNADEWLSIAKEMKDAGTLFILLTGGEPFLYKDFKKVYSGLKKLGMIITINTNATLIDEDMANFLAKDKPRRINITLYGASNETYKKVCNNPNGFDQTMNAIKLLQERNIDIKLNGTLVKDNIEDLPKLIEISQKFNLYIKIDTYLYPSKRERLESYCKESRLDFKTAAQAHIFTKQLTQSEESFEYSKAKYLSMYEYGKQYKLTEDLKSRCRAGKSSFWINWEGKMFPCVFLDNYNTNIFKNGFNKSWKEIVNLTNEIYLPSECKTCDNREICQLCAASCYCETGKTTGKPDYLCNFTNELVNILK